MSPNIIGLINNAVLLLALGLSYDMLDFRPWKKINPVFQQLLVGLLTGTVGIAIMLNPMNFGHGVIFDTRSVLLCLSGFFFGTIPVLLAILITSAFRLFLGSSGAWTGVAVIVTSGGIGLVWRHLRSGLKLDIGTGELYLMGIIFHIAMLAWMLSLPWTMAMDVLSVISLPGMIIYPITTAVLGKLLATREKRKLTENAIRKSEAMLAESNRILDSVLNHTHMLAVLLDRQFNFIWVNQAYADSCGYPSSFFPGKKQ